MRDFVVSVYDKGVVNNIEPQSIPDGAASDSLNWITKGDKIELRRGSSVLGTEIAGTGRVNGIGIALRADGTQIPYRKRGQIFEYYDTVTSDWIEVGTNLFGTAAEDDDILFANYATNAGAQFWFSTPNSSLYKIMTANPGSYADMYDSTKNFKGYINILNNRMRLWGRKEDRTGLYGSHIDEATYTTVTGEATASLGGTLAFKAAGAKRTCFGVTITITATGEVYTDDYNGVLTGSLGGTGTINYMSGVYTLTNAGVGTVNYQWEDSTNGGIADFSKSATRLAGEGFIFRQDDGGGDMMITLPINDTDYCLHERKTWALTLTATDTAATNDLFRFNVGIPYMRAAIASSVGIFYLDVTDENKPLFRKLYLSNTDVIPKTVTDAIDLSGYNFDKCAMIEWNDYIVFSGRTSDASVNNRTFLYHKIWGSIDILDYYASCFAIYNGTLVIGESISNNVVTVFSGFDDSDSSISNYWIGNISELKISGRLKKIKKFVSEGEIVSGQFIDIYIQSDRGGWSLIGTIDGDGAYVDKGQAVHVGALTIGSQEVGGGGDGVDAYHYLREIKLALDKLENRQVKLVATGIGYASVTKMVDKDLRLYASKLPQKYRV